LGKAGAALECAAHTRRREDAVTIFDSHDPADYESCRCGCNRNPARVKK
jgi:hypothetical protein